MQFLLQTLLSYRSLSNMRWIRNPIFLGVITLAFLRKIDIKAAGAQEISAKFSNIKQAILQGKKSQICKVLRLLFDIFMTYFSNKLILWKFAVDIHRTWFCNTISYFCILIAISAKFKNMQFCMQLHQLILIFLQIVFSKYFW